MKKLAKKATGGVPNTKPWGEMNTKEKTNYLDTKAAARKKSVNVNVSGKMANLDADKVRSNQKTTGNNYTFTKVKPGSMSGSDSSYVNRFSKSTPILAKKQNGGPQQPSTKPTTSTELASKNYRPKLGPGSNMMRPDSTKKGDSSKFDPSKVSKNGALLKGAGKISSGTTMYKKLGGSTKKK